MNDLRFRLPFAMLPLAFLMAFAGGAAETAAAAQPATPMDATMASAAKPFRSPPEASLADDEFGKVVLQGERIFTRTGEFAGKFVGNSLRCANCHLDAGRRADSAPLWGAFIAYPAYRAKDAKISTLAERIQGCFRYSMNGKAPPLGDPVLVALESYAYWLAKGAPVGTKVPGSGYPKLPKPPLSADYARGERVYTANCALCHGTDGQGQSSAGQVTFPPLWGKNSFNWGAGMHQVGNAAGFIKANMPLSRGGMLRDQDAWDVAMFMNSHDRPQDPRFTGSVEATRKKFHDSPDSMYGQMVNGRLLGGH
jgi:thiosulfate dehydrogenase